MSNPIDIAAQGLVKAQAQFNQSAARVVAATAPQPQSPFKPAPPPPAAKTDGPADNRRSSENSSPRPRSNAAALSTQGSYLPSLAEETVQMRLAANAYAANAKLVRAADDLLRMTQEALAGGEPNEKDDKG